MRLSGYDHLTGRHCGATALFNLSDYYDWGYDEASCFGYGAGLAQRYSTVDGRPWRVFSGCGPWLERAFLDHLEIPHHIREGDPWSPAWTDVTTQLDEGHPVLVFLDPAALPYLMDGEHVPPHVVVVVGYDDSDVLLSDGARSALQSVPHETFREAWDLTDPIGWTNRHIVVTRPRHLADETDAAARATRNVAAHVLRPLDDPLSRGGPGDEGIPALRSFAANVSGWADMPDPVAPVRAAVATIDWHGEGSACRGLYADALEKLGRRIGLSADYAGRLGDVAHEWRTVRNELETAAATDDTEERTAILAEAGSLLGDIADREEAIFQEIDTSLHDKRSR